MCHDTGGDNLARNLSDHRGYLRASEVLLNPLSTAAQIRSGLSPKRDCGTKWLEGNEALTVYLYTQYRWNVYEESSTRARIWVSMRVFC